MEGDLDTNELSSPFQPKPFHDSPNMVSRGGRKKVEYCRKRMGKEKLIKEGEQH